MPYMIHRPTENLVLIAFKKEGLKLKLNVLYFRHTIPHVHHNNSILVTLRLSDGISQSLSRDCLVTAGSRHSQSLQPMAE